MSTNQDLTQWIHRLSDGDPEAAERVWEAYFQKLVKIAKNKLAGVALRDSDEEDIALSAMHSFCRGMVTKKFTWVNDRHDLWKLLVLMTARKTIAYLRNHFRVKRGGGAVRGESIFLNQGFDNEYANFNGIADVLGNEPTPELADGVVENCQKLLGLLKDERLHKIAVMTLEGNSPEEIAGKLGCVRRTVERKLERIREIWTTEGERT